jgi:hypothetical protein
MDIKKRLEELRIVLRSESISYGELHELQDLGERGLIDPDDVELLEAAGVPEGQEDTVDTRKLELQEGSEDIKIIDVGSDNGDELGAIFLTGDEDFDKEDRKPFAAELVKRWNAYPDMIAELKRLNQALQNVAYAPTKGVYKSTKEGTKEAVLAQVRSINTLLATLNAH